MRPHIQAALAAMAQTDIRQALGLRPLINVSGTMTVLGASIMVPQAVAAMAAIATEFVDMAELHRKASDVVAQATGAQAGFITASCASAITLSVAATMTGTRRLAIERLPDTTGLRDEVLVQTGHLVGYGASLQQSIAMTGAKVVTVGTVSMAQPYQLEEAITEQTACAVFVVSHMTVQYAMLALEQVCAVCHAKGIAVIVDAASEYDLRGFLARGADLVVYSGHKFLGGPTSGIVAGRADLVHAAREQNRGIGRGMKVGKESIAGVMAAMQAWQTRDVVAIRARENSVLALWQTALQNTDGLACERIEDPTGNPLQRLRVRPQPASGWSARTLADALAQADPAVMVRDYQTDLGYFDLDPCNLHPGEERVVAQQLRALLGSRA
ncbi:MAG: aminotransferase class V-fold PLP-dependent enzyme [Rhodoferax sp.]|nr:aminotransferase class V-fold PLP-dependent enzyme [Rhodoferax sp.]MBP9929064.1 aminotransferase class V-fold PLP-dependent enzyme [Rhodoferax sp.]HQX59707.1 aminotransferase class V-fold PLP-dependent enzyme [Burkholderiaceae bacterium]